MKNSVLTVGQTRDLIQVFVGKRVLKVGAGGSTGSIFTLDIGERLVQTVVNEVSSFMGECSLMVYCAWRLDDLKSGRAITGWQENSAVNGVMTVSLDGLLNDIIAKMTVTAHYDLEVIFESGKRLMIFCDLTPNVDWDTNWFFQSGGKYYSVNNSLECVSE